MARTGDKCKRKPERVSVCVCVCVCVCVRLILNSRQTVELQSCSLRAGFDGKCVYLNLSRRVPLFDELRRVGAE